MKKKNRIIILIIVAIVIAILGMVRIKLNFQEDNEPEKQNVTNNANDLNVINQIKNEINATADSDMYKIEEEYDGRKIIQIKPNIQFETVLAGILKNGEPLESEIQDLLQNRPTKSGIWIAKQAREKFFNLLKENGIDHYAINKEGYLYETEKKEEEASSKLKEAIASDKLYMIDISGTSYVRDDISGEIIEYSFEKMEPYQVLDVYHNENCVILEITTNSKGKLSNQEILDGVLENLE